MLAVAAPALLNNCPPKQRRYTMFQLARSARRRAMGMFNL
jgi:hypothetical protein